MPKIWSIAVNGAVWGNRHRSAEETIAEAQLIIDRDKESVARCKGYESTWLTKWVRFDDDGREIWTTKPAIVEVEEDSYVYRKGKVIARWVGGERVEVQP